MAKKIKQEQHTHKDCPNCCPVVDEFLSLLGNPILGRCKHKETWFLINEKTICEHYGKQ